MNILLINPYGIGDVLFTTPTLHVLKDEFPQGKIGYLCNKRTAELLKFNPFVSQIFIYERDEFKKLSSVGRVRWFFNFIRNLKNYDFNAAIDFSLSSTFGFFAWSAGIRKRVGYNYKKRGFFLTDSLLIEGYSAKHIIEYYADILNLIAVEIKYNKPELYLNEADIVKTNEIFQRNKRRVIAIAPGGGASWGAEAELKRWPYEKYARLIDNLVEKYNAQVIMLGSFDEAALAGRILARTTHKVINLCGKLGLNQTACVINLSDLFIGNDGGLLHIAVALNKSTLSFFGPVDPKVYGPYPPDDKKHIVLRKNLECSPCYQNFRLKTCLKTRECLYSIDIDSAIEAVGKLLELI